MRALSEKALNKSSGLNRHDLERVRGWQRPGVRIGVPRGRSAPSCPGRGGVQRTRVSRTAGRRDARLRGRGRARGSAWAGIWGPRRAGAARTRRRGGPGWPGCGSFLEPLARLFPWIVGATHGRGARARARHSRGRSSPRLGDAGLEDPGGRGPPSRSLPRAREGCGTRWAGVGEGRGSPAADLQCSRRVPPFLHKPENSVGEPLPRILAASQFLFLFFLCRGGNKIDHVSEPAVGHSGQRGRNRCFFLT